MEEAYSLLRAALRPDPGRTACLDLTVVVPVYGNGPTLAPLCEQLIRALEPLGISYELLFVNDGSTDHSAEILDALHHRHDAVSVVDLARNSGQQTAILCGLKEASGEACVIMDADLQDPPSALPLLVGARRPDIEAVFAGRRGRFTSLGRHITDLLDPSVTVKVYSNILTNAGQATLVEGITNDFTWGAVIDHLEHDLDSMSVFLSNPGIFAGVRDIGADDFHRRQFGVKEEQGRHTEAEQGHEATT